MPQNAQRNDCHGSYRRFKLKQRSHVALKDLEFMELLTDPSGQQQTGRQDRQANTQGLLVCSMQQRLQCYSSCGRHMRMLCRDRPAQLLLKFGASRDLFDSLFADGVHTGICCFVTSNNLASVDQYSKSMSNLNLTLSVKLRLAVMQLTAGASWPQLIASVSMCPFVVLKL